MRRLILLTFILLASALPNPPTVALAQGDADARMAANTAVWLSVLEVTEGFDELYDRMHPDAQAIVPREAVVGWYTNDFASLGPDVITVRDVRFVAWTWEVTGTTYPNTAEVSYEQPFADGSVVADVVRLVEHDGAWGWFFGRSRAFVDEQIATYADPVVAGDAAPAQGTAVCGDADRWWTETLTRLAEMDAILGDARLAVQGVPSDAGALLVAPDLLARLAEEQRASNPPAAAEELNDELVTMLDAYAWMTDYTATIMAGNLNPLAERGALAAVGRYSDEAGSASLRTGGLMAAFVAQCSPVDLLTGNGSG